MAGVARKGEADPAYEAFEKYYRLFSPGTVFSMTQRTHNCFNLASGCYTTVGLKKADGVTALVVHSHDTCQDIEIPTIKLPNFSFMFETKP